MKNTISITIPHAVLAHIGQRHGDRSKFFTLSAFERLNWRRWIRLKGAIEGTWDTNEHSDSPLKGYKQIPKWRSEGRDGLVVATIFWGPTPGDPRHHETSIYFVPGNGRPINWPI